MTALETQGLAAKRAARVLAVAGAAEKTPLWRPLPRRCACTRTPSWLKIKRTWTPPGRAA